MATVGVKGSRGSRGAHLVGRYGPG